MGSKFGFLEIFGISFCFFGLGDSGRVLAGWEEEEGWGLFREKNPAQQQKTPANPSQNMIPKSP